MSVVVTEKTVKTVTIEISEQTAKKINSLIEEHGDIFSEGSVDLRALSLDLDSAELFSDAALFGSDDDSEGC